eukprot:TRINITY_DN2201_c1_g1_i1.p1 TRINITY_DN2201_c1_g1~~TRINITY_DN2201_c1_g1_i1.p1  ORF type:complete len:255 (+),score=95.42 TRINITY_DN2201_c1_g1_i1:48-767(+)
MTFQDDIIKNEENNNNDFLKVRVVIFGNIYEISNVNWIEYRDHVHSELIYRAAKEEMKKKGFNKDLESIQEVKYPIKKPPEKVNKVLSTSIGVGVGVAGGTLTGVGLGASVGAAIGSFVPGPGNAVGAGIGALIGLISGGVSGAVTGGVSGGVAGSHLADKEQEALNHQNDNDHNQKIQKVLINHSINNTAQARRRDLYLNISNTLLAIIKEKQIKAEIQSLVKEQFRLTFQNLNKQTE